VAVGLGENEGLGDFFAAGEDGRQLVAEGADDGANLVRVDDVAVELGSAVGGVFVLLFPTLLAGQAFALFDLLLRCIRGRNWVRRFGSTRAGLSPQPRWDLRRSATWRTPQAWLTG
jgi:hypothetical protein